MSIPVRLAVCLLLVVVSVLPAAAQSGTTAIYFDSQPGDYIGQGLEQTWTDADLPFTASASADRSRVTISATDPNFVTWWTLDFAGPEGVPLVPGTYESATRYPFHVKSLNGLDVSGSGRGCNSLVGRFRIHEVVINGSGVVERFAADFEQHCEGGLAALYGAVRYRSTRASLVPFDGAYPLYSIHVDDTANGYVTGPGIDCGAGRTDCEEAFGSPTTIALTAVPNPGYVFLGWTGFDCIGVATVSVNVNRARFCRPVFNVAPGGPGVETPNYSGNAVFLDGPIQTLEVVPPGGRTQLAVVPPYGRVVLERANPTSVSFRLDHPAIAPATVAFSAALNENLAPGLFEPVAISQFPTLVPSLQLTIHGGGCFAGGRFRIYEIEFEGQTLAAFSADFEVHCSEGATFTGSIRYNAARPSLLPFDGVYPSASLFVVPTLGGYVTSVSGVDCGDGGRADCAEAFTPQSIVSMQASASPGYQFLAWGGVCTGTAPIITITVNVSGRCLALFHPITDAPSYPFGNEFLMMQRSGVTPTHTVWLPPDARLQVETSGPSITVTPMTARLVFGGNRLRFTIPTGRIVAGEYDAREVTGAALEVPGVPGCSGSRGFFKVYQAEYNPDGTVASFAADFEAYCNDSTYVVGAIRYRASRDVVIPFDGEYPVVRLTVARSPYGHVATSGISCGPSAADCGETYGAPIVQSIQATPSAGYAFVGWAGDCSGGSFTQLLINRTVWCEPIFRATRAGLPEDPRLARGSLTIQSEPGEPIGGGVTRTYFTDSWSVFTFDSRRHLTAIASDTGWRMEFLATGALGVGSYEVAGGLVFPAVAPMLSISLFPRSCDPHRITGRFVIYELRFASEFSSLVESLALDFEQRCDKGPALRGSIRYRSSRSVLQPFADEGHPFTRFDFTGDQYPDLVWQNVNDGRLLLWHLSGVAYGFNEPPSIPQVSDINWKIVGTADADSDGHNDLYWQHHTTGALAIWYMRDTQIVSTQMLTPGAVSDTGWQIRTVFDVDRDGQPDLIWQHRVSGHIAVWHMNGAALRNSQFLGPGQIADPNWTIVGSGDADGDGRPDLYWHHPTTGQLALWYMDGARFLRSQLLTPSAVANTSWRVRGIADLNRDGAPDVVWQNVTTSEVAVWMMSGSRLVESRLITGPAMPAAEWVLIGPR